MVDLNAVVKVLFLGMTIRRLFQNHRLYGKLSWGYLSNIEAFTPVLLAFVRDGIIYFVLYVY